MVNGQWSTAFLVVDVIGVVFLPPFLLIFLVKPKDYVLKVNYNARSQWLMEVSNGYKIILRATTSTTQNIENGCKMMESRCRKAMDWLGHANNANLPFPAGYEVMPPHLVEGEPGAGPFFPAHVLTYLGVAVSDEPTLFVGDQDTPDATPTTATVPTVTAPVPTTTTVPTVTAPVPTSTKALRTQVVQYSSDDTAAACMPYVVFSRPAERVKTELLLYAHGILEHFSWLKLKAPADAWVKSNKTAIAEHRLSLYYGQDECPPGCLRWPETSWSLCKYKSFFKQLFKVFLVEYELHIDTDYGIFKIEDSGECTAATEIFKIVYFTRIHENKAFMKDVKSLRYDLSPFFYKKNGEFLHMASVNFFNGYFVRDRLKTFAKYIFREN